MAVTTEEDEARELARIDAALEAERAGVPLPGLDDVHQRHVRSGIQLDARPFHRWLRRALAGEAARSSGLPSGGRSALADRLRVSPKRITEWLAADVIDESVVDRAVTRYGDHSLWDVYHLDEVLACGEKFVVQQPNGGVPCPDECVSPGCPGVPVLGGQFCEVHAELLARVRAEYRADAEAFTSTIKRPGAKPKCCNPTCWNRRMPGVRFCAECENDGWDEDAIE
jgi:hypothetical protein